MHRWYTCLSSLIDFSKRTNRFDQDVSRKHRPCTCEYIDVICDLDNRSFLWVISILGSHFVPVSSFRDRTLTNWRTKDRKKRGKKKYHVQTIR
ncbi:uncharacterized protein LOC116184899 isoform X2 [Apis dorsata]|uniref:uncharacterized protein LOC116184899 isoform X2 n=1 Tax=Apis dorsata TaxID=7462 RepID=UPI001292DF0B|nr:uncharacterized protein LOC116184899 isoform X2 [Apis dorsata]